jgi:hypothetical protein
MDGGRARKFVSWLATRSQDRASPISIRSVMLALGVGALLLIPTLWNVRQARLTQEAMDRATAAAQAAARAQADLERDRDQAQAKPQPPRDDAVARAARRDPNGAQRVRQLYQEIETLSRIQEHIQEDLQNLRSQSMKRGMPPEVRTP